MHFLVKRVPRSTTSSLNIRIVAMRASISHLKKFWFALLSLRAELIGNYETIRVVIYYFTQVPTIDVTMVCIDWI